MLEASSESHQSTVENVPHSKVSKAKSPRLKAKTKHKPEGFSGLTALVNDWHPSDSSLSRNLLVNDLRIKLEGEKCTCINSCVPALIVDGTYPVEIMHFRSRDDIDEFVTRMVWMQEIFKSAIGVLVGVPDEETSALVKDVCSSLLRMEENCVVLLL